MEQENTAKISNHSHGEHSSHHSSHHSGHHSHHHKHRRHWWRRFRLHRKQRRILLISLAALALLVLIFYPVLFPRASSQIFNAAVVIQPKNVEANPNDTAVFTLEAMGDELKYQWFVSEDEGESWQAADLEGSTGEELQVPVTEEGMALLYRCVVTDSRGNTDTSHAVQVVPVRKELTVVGQPIDYYGDIGEAASFHVTAEGDDVTYRWFYSNNGGKRWTESTANGANTDCLSIGITQIRNGQMYRCQLTDKRGFRVYSESAALYIRGQSESGADRTRSPGQSIPPVISFVDDDGTAPEYSVLYPWIQEQQVPYTFAIPVGCVGTNIQQDGHRKYCSWEELTEMQKSDLVTYACHCVGDDVMTDYSAEEMEAILQTWFQRMEEHKLLGKSDKDPTYMYCHGSYDDEIVKDVVTKYFRAGFTVHKGINTTPFDSFHFDRVGLFPSSGDFTMEDAKAYVDDVSEKGGWLIFFTHCYYKSFDLDGLTELVEYIRSKGIEIAGVEDVLDRYGNQADGGCFNKSRPSQSYSVVDYLGNAYSSDGPVEYDFYGTPAPAEKNR